MRGMLTMQHTEDQCPGCGSPAKKGRKYCSAACYHSSAIVPLASRFWEKVNKDGPVPPHVPELGECWIWTASRNGRYGMIGWRHGRPNKLAHRAAWELTFGEIPPGMVIAHRCDNPLCCRPSHLMLTTYQGNYDDMVQKNRQRYASKINREEAMAIRQEYANGLGTHVALAKRHGVSQALVCLIVNDQVWKER